MKFKSAVYGVVIGLIIGNSIQSYRIHKLKKTLNSFKVIPESELRDYRNKVIDEYDKTLPKEVENDTSGRCDLEDS